MNNNNSILPLVMSCLLCFFLGLIFPEVYYWVKNFTHLSGDFEVKLTDEYRIFRASSREIAISKYKGEVIVSPLLRQIYTSDGYVIGFVEPETTGEFQYADAGYFVLNSKTGVCKKNMNKFEFQNYVFKCGFKEMPKLVLLEDYLKQIDKKEMVKL